MSLKLPRLILMACLLSPSLSWALGLGEIHLYSALNEPMNAEIDLIAASPDELTALHANLAAREAFTRYGIDRPPFLSTLSFKVGKSKDGRDALLVRSQDAIPEPFVTFLVEVNWARGRLMREYTVLLDPPVYTPGERASSAAPVSAPTSSAAPQVPARPAPAPAASSSAAPSTPRRAASSAPVSAPVSSPADSSGGANSYKVASGDTLTKIVKSLRAGGGAAVDQTMIAVYRANPDAFGGNINILKRGSVLRIPGADEIAALNQSEAISEVHRQMDAWRGGAGGESNGHLRLVTPGAGAGTGSGAGNNSALTGENQALKSRVSDLEGQLQNSKRLLELKSNELAELQKKLGTKPAAAAPTPTPTPTPAPTQAQTPPAKPQATPPVATQPSTPPPAATQNPPASAASPEPAASAPVTPEATPAPAPKPVQDKKPAPTPAPADTGSWVDWVSANWWVPAGVLVLALLGFVFAAWRRRQAAAGSFPGPDSGDSGSFREPALGRGRDDSYRVEESGEHPMPPELAGGENFETTSNLKDVKAPDDTMSSESAVNLDQGDPLAEADFHMAYGLYDQAADLVRIALEREPDRRDLRMKLLEIYFVWGNKDLFLQTAKTLESTRDRAPAGEWDKIAIMGKQICPDEPLFQTTAGSGRGAGALVDLNLEGGENRVDIDLFGEPEGERSSSHLAKEAGDSASTSESPQLHDDSGLDFTLDTPERGADDSPTREMPPRRDEPTVESELMSFHDSPTQESPQLKGQDRDKPSRTQPLRTDQTAEVSIDDLGLDLDHLDTGTSTSNPRLEETDHPDHPGLEETDHPSDAPTMVAGLDDKSRRLMAEAERHSRDKDLTELERELEASFIADAGSEPEGTKTAVLGPESAPTVQMPKANDFDTGATSRFKSPEFSDIADADKVDVDSTSRLRGISSDSIDLDLDRLASALGSGDTVEQPRAEDEVFSSEVFDATQNTKGVDLDVGEALNGSEAPTNKLKAVSTSSTNRIAAEDLALPELEPVTMSEVGTKLDLARAYMDMGDPEGARSILEEVVNEGSASQKQEAQRLIEALPG